MLKKAMELQNEGALGEAEDLYLKLLTVMPENADVWNLLGMIAQTRGDLKKAEDAFLAAIKYSPKPFGGYFFNLGLTYRMQEKHNEALEAFMQCTRVAPLLKEGWNFLGLEQAEHNLVQDAVQSFCKALEIDVDYTEARVNLCRFTNDNEALFKIAKEDSGNFAANFFAAKAADKIEDKRRFLKQALAAEPYHIGGLLELAALEFEQENAKEALTLYHKVLNLDDKEIRALLGAADIYLARKEYDKAESYYLKSFEQNREIAGAHLNYGILLYQTGRTAAALEEYRKAAALAPEKPEISYNLALILKETGDWAEALGLMFNAHIKVPENQTITINISETLSLLFKENPELALKIAENWHKQEPDNIFSSRLFAGMAGAAAEVTDLAYSKQLFDVFATQYDSTIAKLDAKIISKFKEIYGNVQGRVLDLGCGTGAAAEVLKNDKTTFEGVDISANMLAEARAKKLYDMLFQQDITTFLQNDLPARAYDLVLAFDVFCYLGNLKEILSSLKGNKICFSVESADDSRHENYYLTPSGRYKHKASYIQTLLKECGFMKIDVYPLVLRTENGEDVNGILFAAE